MQFPYLNERVRGANYITNAFFNYAMIGAIIYMMYPLFQAQQKSALVRSGGYTSTPLQVASGAGMLYTPTPDVSYIFTNTPVSTSTPYPTYTPLPTYTAGVPWSVRDAPTVTKVPFQPLQVKFVFSYYFPDLVKENYELYKANCHVDNLIRSPSGDSIIGCKDTTASGEPWSRYIMYETVDTPKYKGGVAVPYYPDTYNPLYPMGSVITVTEPLIIAGDYLVIDICPACNLYVADKGVLFLDFVARGLPDGVNFWTPVTVSQVLYPWEVLR